jgi:formamidopyrimidine-DNA glycosylase
MPELPEVETMVRGLRPALEGQTIRAIEVRDSFLLQGCQPAELERRGKGAEVRSVGRRGKWVVIALGGRRGLIVIQPRMTGGFWLVPPARPEHVRMTFRLRGSDATVWYCDTRRLGKIAWYADLDAAERAFERSHGPDALEIELETLAARLSGTGRGIKATLLDQRVLAGIGNIYADEILHRSGIHPSRPSAGLLNPELDRLHEAIGAVLTAAIAAEGSSFDAAYRTVLGLEGGFLAQNAVHRRRGEPCPVCGAAIVKTKIAGLTGRPTYFCPGCQPPGRRCGPAVPKRPKRVS